MNVTIGEISRFYEAHPECMGKLDVLTRFGYKQIEAAGITAHNSQVYKITTECSRVIKTSPEHLMLSDDVQWVKTKDLTPGRFLFTKDGPTVIKSIKKLKTKQDLYDLQVNEVKEFFANGLVSHNSTILDSICFALFGKPFRNINKPQLMNSVNKKNLLVEIEFTVGKKQYKVSRGIKPNIFEIYLNGELLNQDAASRDYQKYLEDHVLKLNFKSFTQIVILGSASFTPFMQLRADHRREVIEDLLDIKIFSVMNDILKSKLSDHKTKLTGLTNKIDICKAKAKLQQEYIEKIKNDSNKKIKDTEDLINTIQQDINSDQLLINGDTQKLKELEDSICNAKDVRQKRVELSNLYSKFADKLKDQEEQINFFNTNDACPTCNQELGETTKQGHIIKHREKVSTIKNAIKAITKQIHELDTAIDKMVEVESSILDIKTKITKVNTKIIADQNYIKKLQGELNGISNTNITEEKDKLKSLAKEILQYAEEKAALAEENQYLTVAGILLKDTGIKTRIVNQYLPVINKLVNKYLQLMDFFVSFELDEAFNEKIKSRHRDEFSYASFSEGEKSRIDIAILLAFRNIAKLKNTTSTNLLIMDEVFDSSLDHTGSDFVMSLVDNIGRDTNAFIISHRDSLHDKFNSVIKFEKKNNFSVMV